ncbi:MAG: aldolase [Vicinamibacteria bacterium]|jgi:ribulose-5-phosphate 4-epimerase/fuculose-1-phosphate aldolase
MTETRARDEICRIGASLYARGYAHGTAGNISVRLADAILITPTDACLGFLDPARLARLDASGRQVDGDRASKTIALHTAIYAAASRYDAATACVIHTHSAHCVALTMREPRDELLAPITPYFVMKVGHVPVVPYDRPGAPAVAERVAEAIRRYGDAGTPIRAVMLARLGPNVWHDTPAAAMAVLEEVEETARLVALAGGSIPPLSEAQIDELRRTFGARW